MWPPEARSQKPDHPSIHRARRPPIRRPSLQFFSPLFFSFGVVAGLRSLFPQGGRGYPRLFALFTLQDFAFCFLRHLSFFFSLFNCQIQAGPERFTSRKPGVARRKSFWWAPRRTRTPEILAVSEQRESLPSKGTREGTTSPHVPTHFPRRTFYEHSPALVDNSSPPRALLPSLLTLAYWVPPPLASLGRSSSTIAHASPPFQPSAPCALTHTHAHTDLAHDLIAHHPIPPSSSSSPSTAPSFASFVAYERTVGPVWISAAFASFPGVAGSCEVVGAGAKEL
jgi:hypothetical protein